MTDPDFGVQTVSAVRPTREPATGDIGMPSREEDGEARSGAA